MAATAVQSRDDPASTSADFRAMEPSWRLIDDICTGVEAIKSSTRRKTYLPPFVDEGDTAYTFRVTQAPWRPEFTDALRNLCSKPFTKQVRVNEDAPDEIQGKQDEATKRREGAFIDDVDGRGNSLHVFARDTFVNGVKRGMAAIYVTFPNAEPARTKAEEKASGVRPYWVQIEATNIIALYSKLVNGREVVEHIRFKECTTERDGFTERTVDRIRIVELNESGQPTSQVWRKDTESGKYTVEQPPEVLTGVTEIPIALFFTGERSGNYRVKPPLLDLAHMQIELYQALSREEEILTYAGSPMLKMVGLTPPKPTQVFDRDGNVTGERPAAQMEVGPRTIIWCPPAGDGIQTDADYIQPQAANITAIRKQMTDVTQDFRRLALQPTTSNSGNLTATGAAIEGAKSHSAIEVWANGLKAVLDQALKYTCEWLKIPDTVTANVFTDFGVGILGGERIKNVMQLNKDGIISDQTTFEEALRDGTLSPNLSWEDEQERKAEEEEGLDPEVPIDPRTGLPIQPPPMPPQPGEPQPPMPGEEDDNLQEAA